MYTLRYTYENSMIVTNYLLGNGNGENVKVFCMKLLEIYFIFNWKYDCGDSSSRGENLSGDKRVEKCNQL